MLKKTLSHDCPVLHNAPPVSWFLYILVCLAPIQFSVRQPQPQPTQPEEEEKDKETYEEKEAEAKEKHLKLRKLDSKTINI